MTKVVAPAYSPPVEKPWRSLRHTSRMGDQTPSTEAGGRAPMPKVASAIIMRVKARTSLRPRRSPSCPRITPPSGRATKVTAKTPRENRVWADSEASGRNALPTRTAT